MVFDNQYYDSIPGGVHRHDCCQYWVDRVIAEHGKCRILDVGTGCGFLVKLLRDHGCDAWGIELSDYAIANSCATGYVIKGSVTDIPFKDDSFDVVFSQGVWEYVAESDVSRARDEIWRVGSAQLHNIDHDKCDFREDFVTWKSQEWWDEQLAAPKVLVSCPTHECKEYAHQAWIDMAQQIDYPNYEILVIDNSPSPDCYNRWKDKIPMVWLYDYWNAPANVPLELAQYMGASMEIARKKFLKGNYAYWWNVEIDVIPDPGMLKALIKYGQDADWTGHAFPARGEIDECSSGIGCSLWSRRLIEDFSFESIIGFADKGMDAFFWEWVRPQKKYKTREFWGHLPIHHLKEPEGITYG